jgi:hypothetical protein
MWRLMFLFYFLSYENLNAQKLPLVSTQDTLAKKRSLVYEKYIKRYDTTIVGTRSCYWPEEQRFYIVGNKNGKWELFLLTIKFKGRDKGKDEIKRMKEKRMELNGISIDSLFNFWTEMGFWAFDPDSVNCNSRKLPNGNTKFISMSDGCYYSFEVFTKDKYYVTGAYNAVAYQKEIYTLQREKFLKCVDKFIQIAH